MDLTRAEIFKAMNDTHRNVKEIDGQEILPVAYHSHNYLDAEGKQHGVLVIKDGLTGEMFKTEVLAFIEKFNSYLEAFETLPDEERPKIRIACKISKKGNKYANFELAED